MEKKISSFFHVSDDSEQLSKNFQKESFESFFSLITEKNEKKIEFFSRFR